MRDTEQSKTNPLLLFIPTIGGCGARSMSPGGVDYGQLHLSPTPLDYTTQSKYYEVHTAVLERVASDHGKGAEDRLR